MTGFDHPESAPRLLGAVTVALTAAAGALDAVTFFAFNEVFASTMTGNLILLGLDIGRGRWFQTIEALCAIGGYMLGLVVGTLVAGLTMRRLPWRNAVGVALTVELAVLLILGAAWYGLDGAPGVGVRAVLLVTGGALAMGIQAAALRYVGPSGTPTNFLTGTVTNWVSAMVELHKPRFDGNSALRIVAVAVAAGVAAVIQRQAPDLTYVMPVVLLLVAIVLMARVTVVNHGGLTSGEAQFRDEVLERDARELVPGRAGVDHVDAPRSDGQRLILGSVRHLDDRPQQAALTLIDDDGEQVARAHTDAHGHYELRAPELGAFTLVCSPRLDPAVRRPRAAVVVAHHEPTVHDLVLDAATDRSSGARDETGNASPATTATGPASPAPASGQTSRSGPR